MANTLNAHDISDVFSTNLVVEEICSEIVSFDRATYNQGQNAQYDMGIATDGIAQTVIAKGAGGLRMLSERTHNRYDDR